MLKNGRKAPRSRGGCRRCKAKRFKCDEEKPECGRCQSAGVDCPGYSQPLKWSTKYETYQPKRKSVTRSPQSPPVTSATSLQDQFLEACDAIEYGEARSHTVEPSAISQSLVGTQIAPIEDINSSLQEDLPLITTIPDISGTVSPYSQQLGLSRYSSNEDSTSLSMFSVSSAAESYFSAGYHVPDRPFSVEPSKGLRDFSSSLVEYYFKHTAGLFSCYDSSMNPFRSTVGNFWTVSPALHRTLQSMACACLVDEHPSFGRMAKQLRREAITIIYNAASLDEKSLLALLMIGQSSSWFDPQDLGIPLFKVLKLKLEDQTSSSSFQLTNAPRNRPFFQEALDYWEMLLSFVSSEVSSTTDLSPFPIGNNSQRKLPHPWGGICRETQLLVNQVGYLVRKERLRARSTQLSLEHSINQALESFNLAQTLEIRLESLAGISESDIVNPGDTDTPIWHLQKIAEIYRRTGLINLYRVFPDLLVNRVRQGLSSDALGSVTPHEDDWLRSVEEGWPTKTDNRMAKAHKWLTQYAIDTLHLLESIPASSRTRCLQPFMLVVCASELRAPAIDDTSPHENLNLDLLAQQQQQQQQQHTTPSTAFSGISSGSDFAQFFNTIPGSVPTVTEGSVSSEHENDMSSFALKVFQARKFVRGRLNLFANVLPPLPIRTCVDLVEAIWTKLDSGDDNSYWIDVMMDRGLHTTMG